MGGTRNYKEVSTNTFCWFKELRRITGIMLYNAPIKGEDGLYFVKALTDDKRKCFVQLNKVTLAEVSNEIVFDLNTDVNKSKIQAIDEGNLSAAHENCAEWFGKQLSDSVIKGAYTASISNDQLTGECVAVTKIFNSDQEIVGADFMKQGRKCNVILEFAGIWFAKKAFGPAWNVVQVKVFDEPNLEVYPEEYAFQDDEEEAQ